MSLDRIRKKKEKNKEGKRRQNKEGKTAGISYVG